MPVAIYVCVRGQNNILYLKKTEVTDPCESLDGPGN